MGLLIKLKNGDTQLKSLKFDNGSNQPYIQKDINNQDSQNPAYYTDFILRGGISAPLAAAEDVARLTKYFTDAKNPNGALFIAKQNILSKTGVKTESTKGFAYLGSALNEGYYNPLSTLTEAGVGFLGIHVNKQGGLFTSTSLKKYQDVIAENLSIDNVYLNRLVALQSQISRPSFNGVN